MFRGLYEDFFEALRQRESGGDYAVVNSFGFLGAYQFGEAALVDLGFVSHDGDAFDNEFNGAFAGLQGVFSVQDFLDSVPAQDAAATEWFSILWARIRANGLEFYDGQTLNNIALTKSGMIAAAHLVGVGGLKDLITSGGVDQEEDGFGTSLVEYIELLGNYETPETFLNNLDQDNVLLGGVGDDILNGLSGNDILSGKDGDDILYGGQGDDILDGAAGSDEIHGGQGDDLIDGGLGDDLISDEAGTNTLRGAAGNDIFIIGEGLNDIETGSGVDIIQFTILSGTATISDFEQGIDRVDLSNLSDSVMVSDGRSGVLRPLSESIVFVQIGADTIVAIEQYFPKGTPRDYDIEDAFLIFENATATDFTAMDDFIFG